MVSFTGSTRAGISVAQTARPNCQAGVAQELGGKSANIILEDADFGEGSCPWRRVIVSKIPASPAMRQLAC